MGTLTITINQFSNSLGSGDYIQFTLPSTWTISAGGSTTVCELKTNPTTTLQTSPMVSNNGTIQLRLLAALAPQSSDVTITCTHIGNPGAAADAMNNVTIISTRQGTSLLVDRTVNGELSGIFIGRTHYNSLSRRFYLL